jgi:hypothetical protein
MWRTVDYLIRIRIPRTMRCDKKEKKTFVFLPFFRRIEFQWNGKTGWRKWVSEWVECMVPKYVDWFEYDCLLSRAMRIYNEASVVLWSFFVLFCFFLHSSPIVLWYDFRFHFYIHLVLFWNFFFLCSNLRSWLWCATSTQSYSNSLHIMMIN